MSFEQWLIAQTHGIIFGLGLAWVCALVWDAMR